jgi:hypothetical protein
MGRDEKALDRATGQGSKGIGCHRHIEYDGSNITTPLELRAIRSSSIVVGGPEWRRLRDLPSIRDEADKWERTHYRRDPLLLAALPEDRRRGPRGVAR